MNQKQTLILIVLVAVLGGAGVFIYNKQNQERRSGQADLGKKLLGDLPINDVAAIRVAQGTNQVNLVKAEAGWQVRERNNYPANYNEISDFLLKARDLKVLRMEQVGPSQLPRLSLAPGQGTNQPLTIDLKGKDDKPIRSLVLGKMTMQKSNRPNPMGMGEMDDQGFPNGRFVKVAGSDSVAVISEPLSNIEPQPERWLNKDFFRIEKSRDIGVQYPIASNSWKLTRETESGEWKLADAKPEEKLDATKASGVSNPFSSASFNDVTAAKPGELGLDQPTVITIDTFDKFSYTIKVGQKTNDAFPLQMTVAANLPKERTPGKDEKPEDKDKLDKDFKEAQKKLEEKLAAEKAYEKWTYLVSSWTVDPLLKERAALLADKVDPASTNALPSAVTPPVPDPTAIPGLDLSPLTNTNAPAPK